MKVWDQGPSQGNRHRDSGVFCSHTTNSAAPGHLRPWGIDNSAGFLRATLSHRAEGQRPERSIVLCLFVGEKEKKLSLLIPRHLL